jgi:hypothetical protein
MNDEVKKLFSGKFVFVDHGTGLGNLPITRIEYPDGQSETWSNYLSDYDLNRPFSDVLREALAILKMPQPSEAHKVLADEGIKYTEEALKQCPEGDDNYPDAPYEPHPQERLVQAAWLAGLIFERLRHVPAERDAASGKGSRAGGSKGGSALKPGSVRTFFKKEHPDWRDYTALKMRRLAYQARDKGQINKMSDASIDRDVRRLREKVGH